LVEAVVVKSSPAYAVLVRLRDEGRLDAAPPLFYWSALCALTADEVAGSRCGNWPTISAQTQLQALQLHAPDDACQAPSASTCAVAEELWPPGAGPELARLERLLQVFVYNSFDQSAGDDALEAGGLYLAASMLSHSCAPNAAWHLDEANSFHLHARARIREGEEITIPYLGVDDLCLPTPDRREILSATKDFVCSCERCETALDDTRIFRCPRCGHEAAGAVSAAADVAESIVCRACGSLAPEEVMGLFSVEARLRKWARSRPEFHQQGELQEDGDHVETASASEFLRCAEEGGLAGAHWALDAARAAVQAVDAGRACEILRLRAATYETVPHALVKHARLSFALGRALGSKEAMPEELREAAEAYAKAADALLKLFGDEDPEHREAERRREATERQLVRIAKGTKNPCSGTGVDASAEGEGGRRAPAATRRKARR